MSAAKGRVHAGGADPGTSFIRRLPPVAYELTIKLTAMPEAYIPLLSTVAEVPSTLPIEVAKHLRQDLVRVEPQLDAPQFRAIAVTRGPGRSVPKPHPP